MRRDVMPGFIAAELIVWLNEHKIIRPGYTTLQELVKRSPVRRASAAGWPAVGSVGRIGQGRAGSALVRDDTCRNWRRSSRTPRTFGWRQMARERESAPRWTAGTGSPGAAQTRRLAAESAVLRQPGELLHRPRSTQPEGRSDPALPALLCLGALPAAFRQPGRRDGLPP